ncbi:FKBP-type peptidyl-prolyl cis-trans isomerase [Cellulomonas fimi]|uniref:FKBP-type peptidyl-prolyl cis-trans isomerase n=1 Tax=Cellulomonas fimi TaxID=1708 RepID=UPI00201359A8|nr:FKBP-type peptidyl-prolyl cis-trans isomerase [Cellulomonas fimi]
MRRLPRATVAATAAALLLLAGCSGGTDPGDEATPSETSATDAPAEVEPSAEDVAALEAVTVTEGAEGADPTLEFEQPFTVSAAVARVITEGEGAALEDGQVLSMHYVVVSGADGTTQGSTYGAEPDRITLGDEKLIPALNDVLGDQSVGARVLLAIPGAENTALMLIDVADARSIPTRAEGEPVVPPAGLPVVALDNEGVPSVKPVDGEAPTELVVQPLIKGDGPPLEAGQTVTFNYSGWLWDGTPFDSSWEGAPFTTTLGTQQVIQGWDQGLAGQTVGSQVLLIVPPALGYGDQERGPIPANSTLVFVVDILAVG